MGFDSSTYSAVEFQNKSNNILKIYGDDENWTENSYDYGSGFVIYMGYKNDFDKLIVTAHPTFWGMVNQPGEWCINECTVTAYY